MARNRDRDDDDEPKGKGKKGGGGISLELDDAQDVGLFGPGPATIKESIFADYDYGGNAKPTPVWLITFERDGETYEQPYSVGKGWKVGKDGREIIARAGQVGLPKSSNAIKYLVSSLVKAGMPKGVLRSGDPTALEGAEVIVDRVPQEKRDGLKSGKDDKERSILVIDEIESAPWEEGGKSTSKKKGKASRDEDEDEDERPARKGKARVEEDDEDEDEAPKKKGSAKSRRDDDEDEDEDEKPARGKAAAKGKAKDEDEDEDEGNDLDEEAVEALIEVLSDGPIALDDLEDEVRKSLKGNKQAKAIAARVAEDDFLDLEKGWSVNTKKKQVALD